MAPPEGRPCPPRKWVSASAAAEEAAEDAGLLGFCRCGGSRHHLGRRGAVRRGVLAVGGRHRCRIGADTAGAPVGLALAREIEIEVDARQPLDRTRGVAVLDVRDQVGRGAEHHVVVEVLVAGQVERRHQLAIARRADQEVDVCGPHAVPLLRHHHAARPGRRAG